MNPIWYFVWATVLELIRQALDHYPRVRCQPELMRRLNLFFVATNSAILWQVAHFANAGLIKMIGWVGCAYFVLTILVWTAVKMVEMVIMKYLDDLRDFLMTPKIRVQVEDAFYHFPNFLDLLYPPAPELVASESLKQLWDMEDRFTALAGTPGGRRPIQVN